MGCGPAFHADSQQNDGQQHEGQQNEGMMAFKPNYNQQRAERNRLKQAKKDAKLRERDEAVNRRKAEQETEPSVDVESHETRDS
jgi:hypothetical protein